MSSFATFSQVRAAVRTALTTKSLQSNVKPPLATMGGDGSAIGFPFIPKCQPPTTFQTEVSVAGCTFGDVKSKVIMVLMGDSRAQMWFNDFDAIATASRVKLVLLAKAGCPAAIATYRLNNQGVISNTPYTACTKWQEFMLSTVKRLAPEVIVISSADGLVVYPATATGGAPPSAEESDFAKLFRALPADSKKVALGGFPTPGAVVSPTLCLSKNPSAVEKCAFTPSAATDADNDALEQAAAHTGVVDINQGELLCASECPAVIAGIIPYTIDGYHIDTTYATYLTGVIWADMKPLLG